MPLLYQLNWIDYLVLLIFIFALIDGWRLGFLHLISSFAAYAFAAWITIRYHTVIARMLETQFSFRLPWSEVVGILILVAVIQIIVTRLFLTVFVRGANKIMASVFDNIFGCILGGLNAVIIIAYIFYFSFMIPFSDSIQWDMSQSQSGAFFIKKIEKYNGAIRTLFDMTLQSSDSVISVKPNSNEITYLTIKTQRWNMITATDEEQKLLREINEARTIQGVSAFVADQSLTELARAHSVEMFERRYVSDLDITGNSLKQLLVHKNYAHTDANMLVANTKNMSFILPNFMKSKEKAGILRDPSQGKIGIGIIDGQEFGFMVTIVLVH